MKPISHQFRMFLSVLLVGMVLSAPVVASLSAQSSKDILSHANAALQNGEADHARDLLNSVIRSGEYLAEAHNLQCRVYYALEQWDRAVSECSQAVQMNQGNSNFHMWLGRAMGAKADKSSFLSAYSLAKKTRAEFELAVKLNPRNAEALADLGEFYYSAPGVVGGGSDKAEGVAAQLDKFEPSRAHELRGRIAEQRKDYGSAEREYKQAIASNPHPAYSWMTLAGFYRRRERWTDMEAAVRSGVNAAQADKQAGVALFDGASSLIKTNRDPELAVKMLESYLASPSKREEAPAFVAHLRLARLKGQLGNGAAAQRERAAALALAHDYKPAQDAKH
jgi:tetratricopeptide (TPR) repeat protein